MDLTFLPPTIAAMATLVVALRGNRAVKKTKGEVLSLKSAVNGRLEELLNEVRAAAFAMGVKAQKEAETPLAAPAAEVSQPTNQP